MVNDNPGGAAAVAVSAECDTEEVRAVIGARGAPGLHGVTAPRSARALPEAGGDASAFQGSSALWIRALSRLPLWALYLITGAAVWLVRYVLRYRVAVARENLQRCFPHHSGRRIDQLLSRYYRHLGQVMAEFFKTAAMSAEELSERVTLVNLERVHAETRAGRSVLLLGAHHCNWEWSLHAVALRVGAPMEAAYKPLHDAAADRELRKLRCRFGARLIAAKRLVREIARGRGKVRAVALIADQAPSSSDGRLWMSFLGRDTAFYPGPGQIAYSTGYAAFFAAMSRTRRGHYQIDFQPICAAEECLDPRDFTVRYARLLEALILANPADWTWTHRRWKIPCPYELTDAQTASR
jgi:Kdo2-lipid IVA lauroyltransferase/acyltransferase